VKPPLYYFRSALSDVGARLNKRHYKRPLNVGAKWGEPAGRAGGPHGQRQAVHCPRWRTGPALLPQYDQKQLMELQNISQIWQLEESRRAHWRAYVRGRA
jgi:hypothetical protein